MNKSVLAVLNKLIVQAIFQNINRRIIVFHKEDKYFASNYIKSE